MPSFFGISSSILLFMLSGSFVSSSNSAANLFFESKSWATTTSNISINYVSQGLEYEYGYGSIYYCNVSYNYMVQGITYNGKRANIWSETATEEYCRNLQERVPSMQSYCYYNQKDPKESVLDRSLYFYSLFWELYLCFTFIYAGFGILVLDEAFEFVPRIFSVTFAYGGAFACFFLCIQIQKLTECTAVVCSSFCAALFTLFTFATFLTKLQEESHVLNISYAHTPTIMYDSLR